MGLQIVYINSNVLLCLCHDWNTAYQSKPLFKFMPQWCLECKIFSIVVTLCDFFVSNVQNSLSDKKIVKNHLLETLDIPPLSPVWWGSLSSHEIKYDFCTVPYRVGLRLMVVLMLFWQIKQHIFHIKSVTFIVYSLFKIYMKFRTVILDQKVHYVS